MSEVVARNEPFVREWESRDQSLERFKESNDFMKAHFVERFTKPGEEISFYRNGAFEDFCRGPHVPSTGRVKSFKVTNLAGAYWLGDEKIRSCSAFMAQLFFPARKWTSTLPGWRKRNAGPSRAGQAAGSVFHPGSGRCRD